MDLFEFQVWVGVDYFVGGAVHVFVFDGYVYYPHASPSDDGGTIADFRVDFNIRMFCFGLQR